jgi:STE24 endopeptidase
MSMDAPVVDPERQQQAREYSRISRRLMLLDLVLGGIYVTAWLVFGWSEDLKSWLQGFIGQEWLLIAGFAFIFGAIGLLLDLPISYYSDFILPHRYGQSNQTRSGWIMDQVKSLILAGIFGLIVLEILYFLLQQAPNTWWLWLAGVLLVFEVLLANLAPVLIFPIFYKTKLLGEEYAELSQRLLALAVRAGAKVKGVYQFDMSTRTKSANAALMGLGNTRRIVLGDTLLSEFTSDEIETVLAHELGHQVNKDIPLLIMFQAILTMGGLYLASLGLNWGISYFGFDGPADIAALPLLILVLGIYGLVTMPLGNAISRWRERLADEYALQLTGNGPAFAAALTRLANQNLAEVDPEPWVEFLLYSHPALSKRIAMANAVHKSPV